MSEEPDVDEFDDGDEPFSCEFCQGSGIRFEGDVAAGDCPCCGGNG